MSCLTYLSEDLIDEVDISSCGQEDSLHHIIHSLVILFNATQAGVTKPSIWQSAAVWVVLLLFWGACGFCFWVLLLIYINHGNCLQRTCKRHMLKLVKIQTETRTLMGLMPRIPTQASQYLLVRKKEMQGVAFTILPLFFWHYQKQFLLRNKPWFSISLWQKEQRREWTVRSGALALHFLISSS